MKHRILVLSALFLLLALPSRAQESANDSPANAKRVLWGIKGNLNAELPSKWRTNSMSIKMFNSGFGASIGGLANIYLDKNFYFEPEFSLFYEGYSYDNIRTVAPNSPSVNAGPKIYKLGIRVPVIFGYSINISETWGLNVFTGPVVSYAFYGDAKSDNEDIQSDKNLMSVFSGIYAQRRFDASWKLGVGFPVDHFMISLEADIGMTNLMRSTWKMREDRLSLGITYYFL